MVKGFKDDTGKFRPTGNITVTKRKARGKDILGGKAGADTSKDVLPQSVGSRVGEKTGIVGTGTSQVAKLLGKKSVDFAKNRARKFQEFQKAQKEKEKADLERRRDLRSAIIETFKKARGEGINNNKDLKKFILTEIPTLEDNPEDIKFVQTILNEFIKNSKNLDKKREELSRKEQQENERKLKAEAEKAEQEEAKKAKEQLKKQQELFKQQQKEELERVKEEAKQAEEIAKIQSESKEKIAELEKQAEEERGTPTGSFRGTASPSDIEEEIKEEKKKIQQAEKQSKQIAKQSNIGDEVFAERKEQFQSSFPLEIV